MAPTIKIATISNVVATGRKMNMRDGFMRAQPRVSWRTHAQSASLRRFGSRSRAVRTGRAGRAGSRSAGRLRGRRRPFRSRQHYLCAVAQAVAAFRHHDLPDAEPLGDGDAFAIDDA